MGLPPPLRPAALVGVVVTAIVLPVALRRATLREPAAALEARAGRAASATVAGRTAPGCAPAAPEPERAAFEERTVFLVNEERRAAGLPPLKRVEPLTLSARAYARLMARDDYFAEDHDTYRRRANGRLARVCAWTDRLGSFYVGWNSLGENLASGYETPDEVVSAWMGSAVHRAQILGRGHWETGAGYATGGSEGHYWVQDFGRRGGAYPVVIEGEAPTTRERRVRVFVYGSWREMRLRNDDAAFSPWRTFESEFEWTLAPARGVRTVTVELRGDRRRSAASSDSIRLASQPM
jgi:uncharacterized protein YkwD